MLTMAPAKATLQSRLVNPSDRSVTASSAVPHQSHPCINARAASTNPMAASSHNMPKARTPPSPRSRRPPSTVVLYAKALNIGEPQVHSRPDQVNQAVQHQHYDDEGKRESRHATLPHAVRQSLSNRPCPLPICALGPDRPGPAVPIIPGPHDHFLWSNGCTRGRCRESGTVKSTSLRRLL